MDACEAALKQSEGNSSAAHLLLEAEEKAILANFETAVVDMVMMGSTHYTYIYLYEALFNGYMPLILLLLLITVV